MFPHCCFKEQRYKFFESNSQLFPMLPIFALGCFKEQRYKFFESNSQRANDSEALETSCFKEQRYKFFESNSQLADIPTKKISGCFKEQRYKFFESNSQQNGAHFDYTDVVSKSKDTSFLKAIHNITIRWNGHHGLFQRAKIQVF